MVKFISQAIGMITLHKHEITANIKERYANIIYSFDFENLNENRSNELKFEITIDPSAVIYYIVYFLVYIEHIGYFFIVYLSI